MAVPEARGVLGRPSRWRTVCVRDRLRMSNLIPLLALFFHIRSHIQTAGGAGGRRGRVRIKYHTHVTHVVCERNANTSGGFAELYILINLHIEQDMSVKDN